MKPTFLYEEIEQEDEMELHQNKVFLEKMSQIKEKFIDDEDEDEDKEEKNEEKKSKTINISECYNIVGVGFYQYLILFLCIGGRIMQSVQFYTLPFLYPIIKQKWKLEHYHIGFCNSMIYIGMLCSSFLFGLSDKWGRKIFFCLFHFIFTVISFGIVFSPNYYFFLFFHFFTSFSSMLIDEVMILELVKIEQRGIFISLFDIFFSFGNVYSSLLCYIFITLIAENTKISNFIINNKNKWLFWLTIFEKLETWRVILSLTIIPVIILSIIRLIVVYESPRWLVSVNRYKKAKQVFRKIQIINNFFSFQNILKLFCCSKISKNKNNNNNIMFYEIEGERFQEVSFFKQIFDLFSPKFISTTVIMSLTNFFFFFSYNGLFILIPMYFQKVDEKNSFIGLTIASFFDVLSMFVMVFMIELFPRRFYYFITALLTTIFIIILPLYRNIIYITIIYCVLIFLKDFPFNLMMIYSAEVYPTSIRGISGGLFSMINSITSCINAPILLLIQQYFGNFLVFFICGIFLLLSGILYLMFQYETKNKEMADYAEEKTEMYKSKYLFFTKNLNKEIDTINDN